MMQALQTIVTAVTQPLAEAPSPGSLCLYAPNTELEVPNGFPILGLKADGFVRYFCANKTLASAGEAYANVTSDDGVWVGLHEYPVAGIQEGMPTWFLTNTITGEQRTIWGDNKPLVRQEDPNGSPIDWSRRRMFHDISSLDTLGPDNYTIVSGPTRAKAFYLIRNETTSDPRPVDNTCADDIDVDVPFTARYTFISCDVELASLVLPPMIVPTMAPTALPVLIPAPAPAVLPPAVAPVQAPVPALPLAVPPPAPIAVPVLPVAPEVVVANATASAVTSMRCGKVVFGLLSVAVVAVL